jgi:NADPH2:quinone reductase
MEALSMRGWQVAQTGDPIDVMTLTDLPHPEPGAGEVQIAVGACGLGYPDLLLTQGKHQEKAGLPMTPGRAEWARPPYSSVSRPERP